MTSPHSASPPETEAAVPQSFQGFDEFTAGLFDVNEDGPDKMTARKTLESRAGRQYAHSAFVSPSQRFERTLGSGATKDVDAIAVHRVGADQLEGRMGLHGVAVRCGDLLFYDLLETISLRFERVKSVAPDLMLWLPRARLPKRLADYDALHGLTIRGDTPAGALIGAAMTALSAEAPRATDREFDALAEGVMALIAAAIAPTLEAMRAGQPALGSFVTLRRYIDKNLHAPSLNAASLAQTFGLSRASLYRLFEPVGGVAGFIRAQRLQRAYREIADAEFADRRIGPIAYGLGFKNVSAFNRLFKQEFGASPRDLRAGRRSPEPQPSAPPGAEGDLTLRAWLRRASAG